MNLKFLAAALGLVALLPAQSPRPPQGLKPGDQYRLLIATESVRDGTSADIADYDAFVTADANAVAGVAALNTTWKALVGTPTVGARAHGSLAGRDGLPIYNTGGWRIADDYGGLWRTAAGQDLLWWPAMTPGGASTPSTFVWSGTNALGNSFKPLGGGSGVSEVGNPQTRDQNWRMGVSRSQTTSQAVYGISGVLTVPYPDYPADLQPGDSFRILFVTDRMRSAAVSGSTNLGFWDDGAQREADADPGLSRFRATWKAMVSGVGEAAKARTETAGVGGVPIYRPDGVRIAHDYTHLWGSSGLTTLLAPPNRRPDGTPTTATRCWSGSNANGEPRDPIGQGGVGVGDPNTTNRSWFRVNRVSASFQLPYYAISEVITVPLPNPPSGVQPGEPYRMVVVTDAERNALSANLDHYNGFVRNDVAPHSELQLLGDWRVVGSTNSRGALENTGTGARPGVPIYRRDGVRVAHDYAQFWGTSSSGGGALLAPINVTSSGAVTQAPLVWTGSNSSGFSGGSGLGSGLRFVFTGDPNATNFRWVQSPLQRYETARPFYALSGVVRAPGPLRILTQPVAAAIASGVQAAPRILSVEADGTVRYQWFKEVGGSLVEQPAQVGRHLMLSTATCDDAGRYLCRVFDAAGNFVDSDLVSVQVDTPGTVESYGTGCASETIPYAGTFYERFGTFDLNATSLRFTPRGNGWAVRPCGNCFDARFSNGLNLGDDQLSRGHALGFTFPMPGGASTTSIDIDSNGWIGLISGQHPGSQYLEDEARFLSLPARIAAAWDDLNPAAAGDVYFDTFAGQALITWLNVPAFQSTLSNTFQIQLFANGEFVLSYLGTISAPNPLVGYSEGGVAVDPGPTDLSNQAGFAPQLRATTSGPALGETFSMRVDHSAVTAASVFSFGFLRASVDLTLLGMPGCTALNTADVYLDPSSTDAFGSVLQFQMPTDPNIVGLQLHTQGIVLEPAANRLGVLTSNGLTLTVGDCL